jgi:hypothetical protein
MNHPNVLAIVNGDGGAGFMDLIQVLTGNAYCESGEVIPMFGEYSEGRIRKAKRRVHLYLWFNAWERGGPRMFFPEIHAAHHSALCHSFSVDPAAVKRLPGWDTGGSETARAPGPNQSCQALRKLGPTVALVT